jgi:hypothetical protein
MMVEEKERNHWRLRASMQERAAGGSPRRWVERTDFYMKVPYYFPDTRIGRCL